MSNLSKVVGRLIPLTTLVLGLFLLASFRQWSVTDRLLGHVSAGCDMVTCWQANQCLSPCKKCYIPPCCQYGYCTY
jgi:hypothetical protein